MRWVAFAAGASTVVDRSVPQIVRALQLPLGPSVHATRQRYRNQFFRTFGYLEAMGWLDGVQEAPRAADGRGRCILVRIPAGVAQSVRAAVRGVRRVAAAVPIPAWWRKMASPPSGQTASVAICGFIPECAPGGRARGLSDALGPPGGGLRGPPIGPGASAPAASESRTAGGEHGGSVAAAVRAWREATDGAPWRLSQRNAQLLERYVTMLDELVHPGYGIHWLTREIEFAFEPDVGSGDLLGRRPWDRKAPFGGGRPRSLAYFVKLLRRQARGVRRISRQQRAARPQAHQPGPPPTLGPARPRSSEPRPVSGQSGSSAQISGPRSSSAESTGAPEPAPPTRPTGGPG